MNAPTQPSMCYIRVHVPDGAPAVYRVEEFPCRIGRSPECDIVIGDASVSSLHAQLVKLPNGAVQLEDQWSTNGIFLEHRRVTQLVVDRGFDLIFGRVRVGEIAV